MIWLYFVRGANSQRIKIGISRDPTRRLRDIQVSTGERLELLAVVPGSRKREKELHQRFEDDRAHGEWFRPSEELLAVIAEAAAEGHSLPAHPALRVSSEGPVTRADIVEEARLMLEKASDWRPGLSPIAAIERAADYFGQPRGRVKDMWYRAAAIYPAHRIDSMRLRLKVKPGWHRAELRMREREEELDARLATVHLGIAELAA